VTWTIIASVAKPVVTRVDGTIYGCQRPSRAPESCGSRECGAQNPLPGYLAAIPKDPFTDTPLAYERRSRGYLLYSVAPNGKPVAKVE